MWLGQGAAKWPEDLTGKFDLVMATGIFCVGHCSNLGYEEVHAALKTGGYMVACSRSCFLVPGESEGFADKLEAMVAEGKFKRIHTHSWMHGYAEAPKGSYEEEQESTCYVLQRID